MPDTPEEIARKVIVLHFDDDRDESWVLNLQSTIAAALTRVREEALAERTEECAKIADVYREKAADFRRNEEVVAAGKISAARSIAAAIRALAAPDKEDATDV